MDQLKNLSLEELKNLRLDYNRQAIICLNTGDREGYLRAANHREEIDTELQTRPVETKGRSLKDRSI
jgi:hypothetical protein